MTRFVLLAAVVGLVGSLAACGAPLIQTTKVPVPVECRVNMPARPAMPTESLALGVNLDQFSASAMAEIELREGYEGELRAALEQCTAPLVPTGS